MNDRGPSGPSDDRISRLSAAILRISQSLDLATVLKEVVEGARALTGARSGVITTIDERGQVQDFVTSGLPPEERRMMLEWPDGPRLFEHLRDLPTPLRVADLPGYLGSLGLSSNPWGAKTLQGTPMHHRGEHLGHFFLADKEDGEAFTAEDEEILVLFASQAATAIANARTHLDVERARASLEALVETSPVGVVVFDARTGRPVSFNREAQRIVEEIRTPGHPTEQLLEVMTFRHADGQEISLEEFPLARQLEDATTMRAEEIELSVPDGRSVRTLINVTPIHSEEGELVSVVVTMQDLEPLEELERQRAEFLGMVSHELCAPLTSIKGSTATVLGAAPTPPQAEMLQFFRIITVSGLNAFHGRPNWSHICGSKMGAIGMTRALAIELGRYNILVNHVVPGAYNAHPNLDRIPLGRLGLAQELANTYAFLSSEDASYITGQTFHVNGGEFRY